MSVAWIVAATLCGLALAIFVGGVTLRWGDEVDDAQDEAAEPREGKP